MANRKERVRVVSKIGGVSRTEAAMGPSADINAIIQRSAGRPVATGLYGGHQPRYMDLTAVDYLDSLNKVVDAKNEFSRFPSKIRNRFGNDPYQFLRFLDDPENHDEARRLGILEALPPDPAALRADPESDPHKQQQDQPD